MTEINSSTSCCAEKGWNIRSLAVGSSEQPGMSRMTFVVDASTDALEMIAFRVLEIVGGPELARLIGRGEFKIQAFERLIQDMPGDLREQLQDEPSSNDWTYAKLH